MGMKLVDRVIVVTGSTRGIGRAIAEACAREGAAVVVSSRHEVAVGQAVETLRGAGLRASGLAADVAVRADLERLLEHAIRTWGHVDVWVNNAGLAQGMQPVAAMDPEEIARIVAVNLTGTAEACRLVIPYLIERGRGIVLNMSGKGADGHASPYTAVYAATKAAVTSLTRSLAAENKGHPISIHAIIPGMVATDFYRDMKVAPGLEGHAASLPYVLSALAVPLDVVGRRVAEIAAQQPGRSTGKVYNLFSGARLVRGMVKLVGYRLTGKVHV
jgi:glucose 1-dehydrogenase